MNELRDWLKDADPIVNEPPLSDGDAQRMRRAVVAAGEAAPSRSVWTRHSWVVASVVAALTIAVGVGQWLRPDHEEGASVIEAPSTTLPDASTRRQVQLIAPGGTRVIWVFNDDFQP